MSTLIQPGERAMKMKQDGERLDGEQPMSRFCTFALDRLWKANLLRVLMLGKSAFTPSVKANKKTLEGIFGDLFSCSGPLRQVASALWGWRTGLLVLQFGGIAPF